MNGICSCSHAREADGFVFLTGQFGRDLDDPAKPLPEGIRAQTDLALCNMRRVLASLGPTMGPTMGPAMSWHRTAVNPS